MRLHGQKTDSGGWKGYRRPSKRDRGSRPLHRGLSGSGRRQSRTIPSEAPPRRRSGRRGRAPRVGEAPGSSKRVGCPAPVVSLKPGSLVNWLSTARPSASGLSDCENSPHGFATLRRRPKPGRPPRLTPQQWQALLDILQRGGDAVRFPDRELDPRWISSCP